MIRTVNGDVRALLSDRYRVMDNEDLIEAVFPILMEQTDMEIVSADVSLDRMFIKALWMKVQDTVRAATERARFDSIVDEMARTTDLGFEIAPSIVVERAAERFSFNDTERQGVLENLLTGGDMSAYGLLNAITRTSQDVEDYDRATELERVGGQVLELNRDQWQELAVAA